MCTDFHFDLFIYYQFTVLLHWLHSNEWQDYCKWWIGK